MKPKSSKYRSGFTAAVIIGSAIWVYFSFFSGREFSAEEKAFFKKNGDKGIATLLFVERTGTIVNNIHQYEFIFKVQTDSSGVLKFSDKKLIDPIYMYAIKVGMQIPAYVVPGSDNKVLLLWEEAGIGEAF